MDLVCNICCCEEQTLIPEIVLKLPSLMYFKSDESLICAGKEQDGILACLVPLFSHDWLHLRTDHFLLNARLSQVSQTHIWSMANTTQPPCLEVSSEVASGSPANEY